MPVSDDKLIELLLAERNEHMHRLHAIHAHAAALAVVLAVALLLGAIIGIDALANVELSGDPGRLLGFAAYGFAGGVVLISLALRHHTTDRSAAASHLESAVARLVAGEPRELVLADLAKGRYLASELNTRWLGLTLYQKAFIGCALLLFASLAAGAGMITGYSPEPTEDDDSGFAAALHEARENVKTPAGAQYDRAFASTFSAKHQDTVTRCGNEAGDEKPGTFDIVARVGDDGKLEQVLVDPNTKFAECVRASMTDDEYPAPPQPRYWVNLHLAVRE
jgi:hypothetical protein